MSTIIFLNGAGSSGKTSIARNIQKISKLPWLTFGVDTFITMAPPFDELEKDHKYFSFVPGKNKDGPTMSVEVSDDGDRLFSLLPSFAKLLADGGHNLIIDEVLFENENLLLYVKNLSKHKVYFIGVYCDLEAMQAREVARGNRAIGLSNDQIGRVHRGLRKYDLTVDTSQTESLIVAQNILDYVAVNNNPKGFCEMLKTGQRGGYL